MIIYGVLLMIKKVIEYNGKSRMIVIVMQKVIKTILGYISIRFIFEEIKNWTQREGERNNLGTGCRES